MDARTKRTYSLSAEAVAHVRELVGRVGTATSQDGVVEFAIEQLYRDVRDQREVAAWARAAEDPQFRAETQVVATAYRDRESWPS
jgi:hypothetical protein